MKNTRWIANLAVALVAVGLCCGPAVAQSWSAAGPIPRDFHSAVLDENTNRMVVFGGFPSPTITGGQQNLNDVWRFNGNNLTWTAENPTGTPPAPRLGHTAVYAHEGNRMIVFGGGLGRSSPCTNDVWVLTDATGTNGNWIQLSPSGTAPSPRMQHGSVYDPNTNSMIVYGGQNCFSTLYGDVWVLSHANGLGGTPTWTELAPSGTGPGAREITGGVAYDSTNNILMVFGGASQSQINNDVWILSHANGTGGSPTWTKLSPSGTLPPARAANSTTYDASTNTLTIFGGYISSGGQTELLGDTWALSNANGMGGTPAWAQLTPPGYFPSARSFHTGVYNSSTNDLTIFGGQTVDTSTITLFSNDLWILNQANDR